MYSGIARVRTQHKNVTEIFGYTNKGLPGIEIIGLGNQSRVIKEKILFLLRENRIKIPLKRFVICINLTGKKALSLESIRDLELPIFMILLSLSGKIEYQEIDNEEFLGKIFINSKIEISTQKKSFRDKIISFLESLSGSLVVVEGCKE